MSKVSVGIVDYGIGNHASVMHCLRSLEFRVRVSADPAVLDSVDILLLPGVGAFPTAMKALATKGLAPYLRNQATNGRPLVGICLGMQLLAKASHEHGYTEGLGIIPGEVVPLSEARWHIGWNSIECSQPDPIFTPLNERTFYFNHSFRYEGPAAHQACVTQHHERFASVIRQKNVVGIQFHPEKSQAAGQLLLKRLLEGLAHA